MRSVLDQTFGRSAYMALPTVEEADRAVKVDNGLDGFLTSAGRIIRKHAMQERFGVGLLHRHHDLAPGERMVESEEPVLGRPALVTRPGRRPKACAPALWAAVDGDFKALEYTTDPAAMRRFYEDDVPGDFLSEFMDLAVTTPMGRYLGLAVVDRQFYDLLTPDERAMEYSYMLDRSSVVVRETKTGEADAIPTAWSFHRPLADTVLGCRDLRECEKFCRIDSGTHEHVKRHRVVGEHL